MNQSNFNKCMENTALYRFYTWGYIFNAEHMMRPRRDWKINREQALLFLRRTRKVLYVDSRRQKGEETLDSCIAEDVGGINVLEKEVQKIEKCIEYIKRKEDQKAVNLILEVSRFWLKHALKRFIECYEGEINPLDGISFIKRGE